MTTPMVMATIAEGFDRADPISWGVALFMFLAGLFLAWVGYRFFVEGPIVKTAVGTFSIRAKSRLGFIARAVLFTAIGLGSVLAGLMLVSTMLYSWP
jgi:hypothetical protein